MGFLSGLKFFFSASHLNSSLPTATTLLIANISLNMHSATSLGNLQPPAKALNLQAAARTEHAAEAQPESQKHWPN